MTTQGLYNRKINPTLNQGLPEVIEVVNGLVDEFNRLVGTDKLQDSLFVKAVHTGTNAAFNGSYTTVDSVAITLTVNSLVFISGACDARFNDTSLRTCAAKIVTNDGSTDTSQSAAPFQVVGFSSANFRAELKIDTVVALAAGTYTLKFQCINAASNDSMTTDNSQIVALAVPNR